MNGFIQWIDKLPFAVSNNISISVIQTLPLYMLIIFAGVWFLKKNNNAMAKYAIGMLSLFAVSRAVDVSMKKVSTSYCV